MKGLEDDTQKIQNEDLNMNNEEKEILEQKQQILNNSGVLAAYEYFLRRLCKDGFPNGNVYEFAAQAVLKYEKKKQAEQFRKQTMAKSLAELQLNESLKAQIQVKNEGKQEGKNDKNKQEGKNDKNKSPQKVTKDQQDQKKEQNKKDQQQKGKEDKKDLKIQEKTDPKQKKK
ncbi:unnamed protein product [Paramecium sonneborni]|uniref:Uncharacterized protein n=1 Tax=Paramecium sonneborni TaxID=65129 RepID=A0A8S1P888_9CILI|nr:unnamed protein product [Paramecium sonneborni]